MKRLHILFVTEYFPPHIGGVETFFYELRKALVAKGHKVDVLTSSQPGAPLVQEDEGGTVYRVRVPEAIDRYAFTFLAIPKAAWLAKKADIVHATTYNAIVPGFFASKINRKRSVLSVHEVLSESFLERMKGSALKASIFRVFEAVLLMFPFDKVVAVSKSTQKDLPKRLIKKSTVIYHGIDNMFSPGGKRFADGKKTFLFYGRTAAQKGLWFLLKALPDFFASLEMKENIRFRLIISGSKKDRNKIRHFLKANFLNEVVSVEPSVERSALPDAIRDSYCTVVPSFAEGFGFAAAEASACGTAVLASDAGSLPEVVSGKHLLFESGDRKSLLKNLRLAADNKWEYKKAHEFTWEKAADEFIKLYTESWF